MDKLTKTDKQLIKNILKSEIKFNTLKMLKHAELKKRELKDLKRNPNNTATQKAIQNSTKNIQTLQNKINKIQKVLNKMEG